MQSQTLPGTVQIRVIADEGQTDQLAIAISDCLNKQNLNVIETTCDYQDRLDKTRRKFHITAIPADTTNKLIEGV